MSNVLASVSISMHSRVPNAPTVYHHAHVGMLIGLYVPTFATLVGRIGLRASGSTVRSSAQVSILAHMQLPVARGYAVDSIRLGRVVSVQATVLRGAKVSINSTSRVSDTGHNLTTPITTAVLGRRVTASSHILKQTTVTIGARVGMTEHARVIASGVDVIKMALGVVARAFPHYAVQVRIGTRVGVVAVGQVPLGVRVCHVSTGIVVSARARVVVAAVERLQIGLRMTASPHVGRQASVTIRAGLWGLLKPRNLIGGHVGVGISQHVSPSEGRGVYGRVPIVTGGRVQAYATIKAHTAAGMRMGISVTPHGVLRMGGHLTVKATLRAMAGMIRTAHGATHVVAGITIQAAGDRNSLGGIQSTVTPINPKGSVSQLGPTSTISVIP